MQCECNLTYLSYGSGLVLPPLSVCCVGVAICYALPVVQMASFLHTMARNRRRDKNVYSNWLNSGSVDFTARHILKMTHQGGSIVPGAESDIYDFLARVAALHCFRHRQHTFIFSQLPTLADNVTLLAFAAARRAVVRRAAAVPGGRRCRSISPGRRAHSSKPAAVPCSGQ